MEAASSAELAEYIRTHLAELARLARRRNLRTLAYLIEIAWLEAEIEAQPKPQEHTDG